MLNDTDRAVSALNAIPNDLSGDDWLRPSIGAKAAGVDFDTWHAWCAGAPNYKGESDCRARWKSFDATGPIQAGTLFKAAAEHGWRIGGKTAPRPAPARATRPPEPTRKPAPAMDAAEVWARLEAVKSHAYCQRKQLPDPVLKQLRVVGNNDPLKQYRGWLAVPGFDLDGTLQTIEFVAPDGQKRTLAGTQKAGAIFTAGPDTGPIVVVEGLATAGSVFCSTGQRAISTFGCSNTRRIVEALRQREPETRIVIAPDRGQEGKAQAIATEFNCAVATMPETWPNNADLNDVFCSPDGGFDVVQGILQAATEPPKPEPKVHPLARYVTIDGTAKPPRWVIPGFIGHGVTVISGAHGVGKTTALLPLAMTAAGLHGEELLPRQWRHLIYCCEDVEQARRILAGIIGHSNLGIDAALVTERLHLVEAVRLDPAFVASVGTTYREQFTRTVQGVDVLPLVVLDTKSAVLAVESENDNSEASRMMAALKQGFDGLPVWLVGHVAKANLSRNDALTSRGASAIEADANQTLFLIREGESRYLVQGKTRFESRWPELEIVSYTAQTVEPDEFGNSETVLLRWGIAAPAQQSRKEAAEQAAEQQRKEDDISLRQDIRDAVELAWLAGNPLNKAGVLAKVSRKRQTVSAMIENLLNERWLYEVTVPAKDRTNNKRAAFLVNFTTEEHEAVIAGACLPAAKLEIPQSWQKPVIPSVPAPGNERGEADHE